jgi:hypothetical protein
VRRASRVAARPHKYGAKATTIDGHTFPSKREAARYAELRLLEKAGEITSLVLQPRFSLHVGNDCAVEPIGEYRADFSYWDCRRYVTVVEDAKGFKTPLYRWKKKHVMAQYGIEIKEV